MCVIVYPFPHVVSIPSSGVVPWLTERQAKCPLCKFDVADYLRQYQQQHGNGEASGGGATTGAAAMVALWNPLSWVRYHAWTAVSSEGEDGGAGSGTTTSSATGSTTNGSTTSVYDDEERPTVVMMELVENSATLT